MLWYDPLPPGLPEGRLVTPYNGTKPCYWLSVQPVARRGTWAWWHSRHNETGLWPLLVSHVQDDDPIKPDAEYDKITTIDEHHGPAVLAQWWQEVISDGDPEEIEEMTRAYRLDTVGRQWPGIADPPDRQGQPQQVAEQIADLLIQNTHLALVPAVDGAHAITAIGWTGPLNHDNDTAKFAAIVREWQHRFGATVVGLSFDTLTVSVAAPPATLQHALRVTAEHFAFCPDNIWQSDTDTFPAYAEAIRDRHWWTFWWD